jgi:hypothetical protein
MSLDSVACTCTQYMYMCPDILIKHYHQPPNYTAGVAIGYQGFDKLWFRSLQIAEKVTEI